MANIFNIDKQFNNWDNLKLDVKEIYAAHPSGETRIIEPSSTSFLMRFIEPRLYPCLSADQFARFFIGLILTKDGFTSLRDIGLLFWADVHSGAFRIFTF